MKYEITRIMNKSKYIVHIFYNDVICVRDIIDGHAADATRITIIDHKRGRWIAEYVPGKPIDCMKGLTENEIMDINDIADTLRYEYGISGPIWNDIDY